MGNGFDYGNMTDHDLLVVMAQNVHDLKHLDIPEIKSELKGMQISQGDLSTRLTVVETKIKIRSQNSRRPYAKIVGGGTGSLGIVGAIIYGVGRAAGWW